ncbi:tryptophan synthase subunit alpha [Streptomyces sp. NPDC088768]|uniref:tryptophan synthase subunit alpha n=1 Tax=Streptomyces sp. NPDC088768 TaxID=3365894 RepID=UPI00380705B7
MTTLSPAADKLIALLEKRRRPALGAFLPAGFPNWKARVDTLRAFTRHRADFLEADIPHHIPSLDGPDIRAAHTQAGAVGAMIPGLPISAGPSGWRRPRRRYPVRPAQRRAAGGDHRVRLRLDLCPAVSALHRPPRRPGPSGPA